MNSLYEKLFIFPRFVIWTTLNQPNKKLITWHHSSFFFHHFEHIWTKIYVRPDKNVPHTEMQHIQSNYELILHEFFYQRL